MRQAIVILVASSGAFTAPRRRIHKTKLHSTPYDAQKEAYLAEPEFDAVSLRQWRRETLVRYNNANQSEPLRVVLFFLLALALLGSNQLADAVGAPPPEPYPAYLLGGLAAAAGFQDQRNKRTRRLTKIEREAAVGDLEISMKPAAARVFPGLSETASLRSLRRSARVLAVLCPDEASFTAFTDECRALRRRLKLSSTIVLGVRGDGATDKDASFVPRRGSDLLKTFGELLNEDASWGDFEFAEKKAAWFALSYAGRSVGSGTGAPDFLELLGSLLPPRDFVEPLPPLQGGTGPLDAQKAFYDALTSGDLDAMRSVLSDSMAPRVSAALEAGARLDPWESQLRDDARPSSLKVGDADEFVNGDNAYTTCVEETGNGATLLAYQKWTLVDGAWKLLSHETIPFAPGSQAGAVLKCDKRGCIALVRRQQGNMRD